MPVVVPATVIMSVVMMMIMAAGLTFAVMMIVVPMIMAACFSMNVLVIMVVATARSMRVIMSMVVPATLGLRVFHGGQIEQPQNEKANPREQYHGPKNSIRWEVVSDATAGVKVKHHTAPEEEEGHADEVNPAFRGVHDLFCRKRLNQVAPRHSQ